MIVRQDDRLNRECCVAAGKLLSPDNADICDVIFVVGAAQKVASIPSPPAHT